LFLVSGDIAAWRIAPATSGGQLTDNGIRCSLVANLDAAICGDTQQRAAGWASPFIMVGFGGIFHFLPRFGYPERQARIGSLGVATSSIGAISLSASDLQPLPGQI